MSYWWIILVLKRIFEGYKKTNTICHLTGEQGSFTHGSVIDGKFEGFIQTHSGTFYIEPAERYIKDRNLPFHSVIYHEDDISEYFHFVLPLKYFFIKCQNLYAICKHQMRLWVMYDPVNCAVLKWFIYCYGVRDLWQTKGSLYSAILRHP